MQVDIRGSARGTWIRLNPRVSRAWANGLPLDFETLWNLDGEVVSGHPRRHVMRVKNHTGRAFLKREHRVPWRDRWHSLRDGFGFASLSRREAATLEMLARNDLPVPNWLAVGEAADGRALLLLAATEDCVDLRQIGADLRFSLDRRHRLAQNIGAVLAKLHDAGFAYPDCYAKHILVNRVTDAITLIDWQRSPMPRRLSWRTRCRDLAALHASLADQLAGPALRRDCLAAYLRSCQTPVPPWSTVVDLIRRRTEKLMRRSSIREQRLALDRDSQPLRWLDGVSFCVTPIGAPVLESDEWKQRVYTRSRGSDRIAFDEGEVELPDGRVAILAQRRTVRPLGRLFNPDWLAPECLAASQSLRSERLGHEPVLLAFGQRESARGVFDSFLLTLTESRGHE